MKRLPFGTLVDTGDFEGRVVVETRDYIIIVGLSGEEESHRTDGPPYWEINKPNKWNETNELWWEEYLAR